MKLFQKKKNNKGFSLVELIVVVAIMAVLLGVLVPTLVRHIESSRLSKDKKNLDELRVAMEVALANEDFADITCTDLTIGTDASVDINTDNFRNKTSKAFYDEVVANFSNKSTVTLTSKLKKGCGVTVTINDGRVEINVKGADSLAGKYTFSIPDDDAASDSDEDAE